MVQNFVFCIGVDYFLLFFFGHQFIIVNKYFNTTVVLFRLKQDLKTHLKYKTFCKRCQFELSQLSVLNSYATDFRTFVSKFEKVGQCFLKFEPSTPSLA